MIAPMSGFHGFGNRLQGHPKYWKIEAFMPEVTILKHYGVKHFSE